MKVLLFSMVNKGVVAGVVPERKKMAFNFNGKVEN